MFFSKLIIEVNKINSCKKKFYRKFLSQKFVLNYAKKKKKKKEEKSDQDMDNFLLPKKLLLVIYKRLFLHKEGDGFYQLFFFIMYVEPSKKSMLIIWRNFSLSFFFYLRLCYNQSVGVFRIIFMCCNPVKMLFMMCCYVIWKFWNL